ncbi:geranylgeranyl pyrophosphate synthase [Holotrichia oblita]|uniref:Geranylgeranyl pyrophosphate synthase n=1 Tax=Holotrichia oblita TaxID=644536 RepID=A0ACB9TE81_HOLOL|nr:geranylgeranyl pyrophosphate synthase [Holotrichia oblita]
MVKSRADLLLYSFTSLLSASTCVLTDVKRRRRFKVRPLNKNRDIHGHFATLVKDMKNIEPDFKQFFKYTRMTPDVFEELLKLVKEDLQKTPSKKPLSPAHRLLITLHYLAEGCSMQELLGPIELANRLCIIL